MTNKECPERQNQEPWLRNHLMKLESSSADREVWRCVSCGLHEVRPNPFVQRELRTKRA
jgi:hypothetical protein